MGTWNGKGEVKLHYQTITMIKSCIHVVYYNAFHTNIKACRTTDKSMQSTFAIGVATALLTLNAGSELYSAKHSCDPDQHSCRMHSLSVNWFQLYTTFMQ